MAAGLTSLSSLFLNPYAQTQQAVQQASVDPLKAGSTVTARYRVDEHGELNLRDLQVEEAALDSAQADGRGQQRANNSDEKNRRQYTFNDVARPKATLSPSDEVALFAAANGQQQQLAAPAATRAASANGASITDVVVDDAADSSAVSVRSTLQAQKQLQVATQYARNSDIVFNVDPIFSQAA